jgi:flagellar biosynthesis protein FlhA
MAHTVGSTVAIPRGVSAHVLDFAIPATILMAVLVVLAPVPAPVVDLLLAANLTVSVLALLGALAARTPLEMSVFPTFLLGATLVRLVLNIATTRLVLTRAAIDGTAAAGDVVRAFGEFVAANNLVVGAVIFAIIAVIQFVVITAGSTRTSEVAARFALDGLPGRQMAIDADLQAGAISRDQARQLRADLQRQADFFASMDGASRFIRGEAVAGVIITAVNIVGGLAVGVAQHGMPVQKALDVYSRLTIGDGLASAVPSLFVSVATGLLISRSSQAVDLSAEFGRQFTSRPHVLVITAVFLGVLCFTDLPPLPLAAMAVITMAAAWLVSRRRPAAAAAAAAAAGKTATPAASLADTVLAEDRIVVRVGRGLVHLVAADAAGRPGPLVRLTADLRTTVATDLGLLVPEIHYRDDLALAERGFTVTIAGDVVVDEELPAGKWLVLPAAGTAASLAGEEVTDPLSRRRAAWVGEAQAETAVRHGAVAFDPPQFVARSLEAAIRRHADRLLTRDAVARLVESLRASQPAVVDQIVPGVLPVARIHRTLQALLRDGVPVRPLAELLEVMADHAAETTEPGLLAEILRRHLARAICRRARDPQGRLTVVRLGPAGIAALVGEDRRSAQQTVATVRRAVRPAIDRGAAPVVVVPAGVRARVRDALAKQLPEIQVFAAEDLVDEPGVDVFATLGEEEVARAA